MLTDLILHLILKWTQWLSHQTLTDIFESRVTCGVSSSYLFVTKIMHPCRHVNSELQQLLRSQSGSGAVLLGKGGIGLQHPTLPQEVEKVSVRSIFNGYVQVTCTTHRRRMWVRYTDICLPLRQQPSGATFCFVKWNKNGLLERKWDRQFKECMCTNVI